MDGSGSGATVRDSDVQSFWVQDGAEGLVIGNTIARELSVYETGPVEVRNNLIDRQDNLEPNGVAIEPFGVQIQGASPLFVGNTVRGHVIGIEVITGAPTIEDNTIEDNTTGVSVRGTAVADGTSLRGNTFCGNITDLTVPSGSTLTLEGNEVCEPQESAIP
jgi:hypothetical protein